MKTGNYGDCVILDSECTSDPSPFRRALTDGRAGTDPLFRFSQESYSRLVKEVFVVVGGAGLAVVVTEVQLGTGIESFGPSRR